MARELQQSFIGGEVSQRMFGRVEDPRLRHGAAKLQNMIVTPQGPAQKRPGLGFVREVKNSANRARLIPFSFSQDDTLVIEMGNDTVDSRDIGYFRFHTDGGTVFYQLPRLAFIASVGLTGATPGTDTFTTNVSHSFNTGDPVAFSTTSVATHAVSTFAAGDPGVVTLTNNLTHGQQIRFVTGGGTFPPEVTDRQIYYASNPTGADTRISASRFGPEIEFSAASSGTINTSWLPHMEGFLDVQTRYYVIDTGAATFQLAATLEDALAGTQIDVLVDGSGADDGFVSFDYVPGDLVTNSGSTFFLFQPPLGGRDSPIQADGELGVNTPPFNPYWYRLPGTHSTVTFDLGDDEVDWTAHGHSNGTEVVFSTTDTLPTGITAGTIYYIINASANAFQIAASKGGAFIPLGGTPAGTHTALAGSVFEIPHFFTTAEIQEVGYAQSNDVVTFAHPNKPPLEIRRMGATSWTVAELRLNPVAAPSDVGIVATFGAGQGVTSVTAATPASIILTRDHGITATPPWVTVYIQDVGDFGDGFYTFERVGTAQFNVLTLHDQVDVTSGTTALGDNPLVQFVSAHPEDFVITYVMTTVTADGEESGPSKESRVTNNMAADGAFNTLTWTAVAGAGSYRVYKKENGLFGFIGEVLATEQLSFKDDNIAPDFSQTAPIIDSTMLRVATVTFDFTNEVVVLADHGLEDGAPITFYSTGDPTLALPAELNVYQTYYVRNPSETTFSLSATPDGVLMTFSGGNAGERVDATFGLFPASVSYFEQRRCFAGSLRRRQRVWMTASGTESDLSFSIPTVDSDRIKFDVASLEAGAVRHVVPLSHLMVLSASTEFRVTPINSDAITPTSISVRPQSFVGASTAQPVVVNNNGIFAANRGGHVRQMGFGQDVFSYLSGDLSLRATHLFDGLSIDQLAYAKAPIPTVWAVSSNGNLLALTYIPEEQVLAWHQHTTTGTVESVAVVAEGMEDHAYVIVNRTINSATVRYVERMSSHDFATLSDGFFVDAGFTYDDVATTTIAGLDHLEGETVVALADGLVVTGLVVSSGAVTLTTAASKVHIGIPYTAEIETLPVSTQRQAAGRSMEKNVSKVWLRVEESGAFKAGPTTSQLVDSQSPAAGSLLSDSVKINIPGDWNHHGQIFLQQTDPLPLTVVSVVYEIAEGGF